MWPRAKLAQVKAGPKPEEVQAKEAFINRSEAEVRAAERDLGRTSTLLKRAAGSRQDFDDQTLKYEQSRDSVDQARAELAALKAIRPADIKVAEAELVQAEAGLALARADLEAAEVRSPVKGQVLRIHVWPGERVGDQGIVEIGDTEIMHAVAEVYEQDVGKVEIGQKAKVRIPTLGADLTGEVVRKDLVVSRKVVFSNDPVADIDARVVEVRIELSAGRQPQSGRPLERQGRGGHRRGRTRQMRSPFRSLPIAWLQLTHGRTKLVAAVVGIVFADLLMWMQLGFLGAALASATTIHRQLRGDLVILNPHTHQITSPQPFARGS